MRIQGRTALILLVFLLVLSACSSSSSTGKATSAAVVPTGPAVQSSPMAAETQTAPAGTALPATSQAAEPTVTSSAAAQPGPTEQPAATATRPAASITKTANQAPVPTDSVQSFPDPASFTWVPVVTGLSNPLGMAAVPDGSGRLLLVEQAGTIRVAQNGSLLDAPFLDITDRVGSQGNEQGLLGLALHPQYTQNGFFYVNYTDKNGNTVIARFSVTKEDPNRADPNSEKDLLHVDQPYPNHNGGSTVFGPDGYLYLGLGDGGSGGDPRGNGQSLKTYLGKILRLDVNSSDPYGIPPNNPFAKEAGGQGGALPEIWAYGLRNPWRFSFDRLTGDLYIADVGQDSWEEIDFLAAGSPGGTNFGWNYREGKHAFQGTPPGNLQLADPVFDYPHGQGCSVTGGMVYRGQALPEFHGIYLFADYCSGRIWGLLRGADGGWQSQQLYQNQVNITSFGEDTSGEIYAIDQASGSLLQFKRK